MSDDLTQRDRIILLALMVYESAEDISNSDLAEAYGLEFRSDVRERLESHGYLHAVRGPGPGRPFLYELTDKGRVRAEAELSASAESLTAFNPRVAYALFNRVGEFLERNHMEAAAVFGSGRGTTPSTDVDPALVSAVNRVYSDLASRPSAWVSLRQLRHSLPEIPRAELDDALIALYGSRRIRLTAESNRKALRLGDHEAALTVGGDDKHLILIG